VRFIVSGEVQKIMAHYENGKQKRTKTRKEKAKEGKSLVVKA